MKSKFFLIGKKSMSLILTFMLIFSTMAVGIVTASAAGASGGKMSSGDTLYYDLSAIKDQGGAFNYLQANGQFGGYQGSIPADGIFSVTFTNEANLSDTNLAIFKWEKAGWYQVNSTAPADGQNMVIVASDGKSFTWGTYGGSSGGDTPSTGITVYFKNTSNWSSVYCYAWISDTETNNAAYPGQAMTKVDDVNNIYKITLTNESFDKVLFTKDKDASEGAGTKTADLSMESGMMYDYSQKKWVEYSTGGDTPTTRYYITGRFAVKLSDGSYKCTGITSDNLSGTGWNKENTSDVEFSYEGNSVYKLDTGFTLKEMYRADTKNKWYFQISDGTTKYRPSAGEDLALTISDKGVKKSTGTSNGSFYFNNETDTTDTITLYFNDSTKEVYFDYTNGGTSTTPTNKSEWIAAQSDGLFIDANPSAEADADFSTLIKWNNKFSGTSGRTQSDGNYRFYVPKNVALSTAKVYNAFSTDVKLNNVTIPSKGSAQVNLTSGNTYSTEKGSVKVMQGSTDAMFFYTTKDGVRYDLPTVIDAGKYPTKGSVSTNGGTCTTMRNDTATPAFTSSMALSSVKGRGNSSWEASSKIFGKYAFNMKLKSATDLLGMSASKSYCLLANNVDEAMLRNAFTYSLAAAIGLYDSPEFRFVDIYDNGEYLGQYLVTEKVDVGKDKLINNTSIDKINEDAATEAGITLDETTNPGTYSFIKSNGDTVTRQMQYCTVGADPNFDNGTFLLEFELEERYTDEASWFISPEGQHVVVKSPEFATKRQVEYIAQKFAAMEEIAYNASSELSSLFGHIDLDSFARMYLIQELSANLDSAATSYYLTFDCAKGSDARFVASPVWDYDWAFGQYQTDNAYRKKADKDGNALNSHAPEAWFAKNKAMGGGNATGKYSLQSALANHSKFQSVIKKVWNGSSDQNGFYKIVQTYYNNNGQLDQWKNQIYASVAMNEARWGFIASDPATEWGSVDNADTFEDNVTYLKTTWTSKRASWLNTEINKFTSYTQISSPDLQVFNGTSELTSGSSIDPNTALTFKVSTKESFVTYELYDGATMLGSNTTGEFTHTPTTSGVHSYSVKTVYNSTDSKESTPVKISLLSSELSVSLSSSKSTAVIGESITLTADVTPADGTYMYTYYSCDADGNNRTVVSSSSNKSSVSVTVPNAGANYYIVSVTNGTSTVTSNVVTVTATASTGEHTITVNFKGVKSALYTPTLYLNGASVGAMTVGTELGHSFSNTTKFCWYTATITVDSSKNNTISFKNTRIGIDCSITDRFNNDTYYLAAKDMIADKNVIDLSGEEEYIQNFYHTARNMVYSADGKYDRTLGYTNINGQSHRMGEWIDQNNPGVVSVKSATLAQMTAAGLANPDYVQACLLDTNMDKSVNVLDATMIQAAIVNE